MKTYTLFAVLFSIVLFGCKQNQNPPLEIQTSTDQTTAQAVAFPWENEIHLDQGSKWKANRATTKGINNMLSSIENSSATSVEDYHQLAERLNEEKNTLIKKCTMRGASHDNLHIYLTPLIDKISRLEKVNSEVKGQQLTSEIEQHLQAYFKYFT